MEIKTSYHPSSILSSLMLEPFHLPLFIFRMFYFPSKKKGKEIFWVYFCFLSAM